MASTVSNEKAARQPLAENERSKGGVASVANSGGSSSVAKDDNGRGGGARAISAAANGASARHGKSEPATKCDAKRCQLPACRCGSAAIPGGLLRNNTPQLIVLTFDDAVNDLSKRYGNGNKAYLFFKKCSLKNI